MTTPEANSTQNLRPDEDILADLWEAVWQVDTIRSTDRSSISIAVHGGVVTLTGHVAGAFNRERVESIAWSAPGVRAVHTDLVADGDLEFQVAQALSRDARTRPCLLRVGSYQGWIRLGGTVPSREIQQAAEAVAAGVPAVRGVIALPRVAGETVTPLRRAVQPRPGASVYGADGQAGLVVQVVINPSNRLVTHMAVRSNMAGAAYDLADLKRVTGDYLVPIEAAEVVSSDSVFLTPQPPSLAAYPPFDASAYPPAPSTWRPPYPYEIDMVRWPRLKAQEPARQAQPAGDGPAASAPDFGHVGVSSRGNGQRQGAPQPA